MPLGTNLLVQIFEVLVKNQSKEKIIRRLYCESGQAGTKSYRFVNDGTRDKLKKVIPKCADCKYDKLRHVTVVLVFEELARLHETELLKNMYHQIGSQSKYAYTLCNSKTKSTIQKLGLTQ